MGDANHAADGSDRGRTGIFIVTPIRLYRDGLAHFLRASAGVAVLATVDESATAVAMATDLVPDVILLDMALEDSRETARELRSAVPSAAIVALAVPDSEGYVVDCAEAGISAYVPREGSLDELLATILRAASGEATCSPRVAGELFRRIAALSASGADRGPATRADDAPSAPLTVREAEVIALIDDGMSNKQIARALCIEVPTVKNHVHSILEKLGARSRGEAAALARGRSPVGG
jgi:two-component system, NarL family, nitrate/nitrite response regulator NarL